MFMSRVNGINQYKHGITRTYLYLDDAGNCYVKAEKGGYVPGNWGVELGKMEDCLARLDASLATPTMSSLSFGSVTHCSNKGFRF